MIRETTEALVDVIRQATPDLGDWVVVHSLSADETPAPSADRAVLALVDVAPHPHLVNRPLVEGLAGLVRAPLGLRLDYLVTYFGPHDEAQTRLARIVQAFHTTPIVSGPLLQPPLSDAVESITIRLLSPTHDERQEIWAALGRAGRLSLYYEVDVAPVAVLEREGAGRIRQRRIEYVGSP